MSCNRTGGSKRRSRKGGVAETEDQCIRDGGEWMDGKCQPAPPPMGGRHRNGHKSRKMRGGVMVGAVGPIAAGAMEWGGVDTSSPADPVTGVVKPETFDPSRGGNSSIIGGKRRKTRNTRRMKKSKKASKKSRSSRRSRSSRKMKGGAWNPGAVNVAGAGYAFAGATPGITGGIAPATGYQSRVGGAPMGRDGIRSA